MRRLSVTHVPGFWKVQYATHEITLRVMRPWRRRRLGLKRR